MIAAMPEAKARAPAPPSRTVMFSSRRERVGFCVRRVLEALVLAEPLLDVGRGLVDRERNRARRGLGRVAGVDAVGREAHSSVLLGRSVSSVERRRWPSTSRSTSTSTSEDPLIRIPLRAVREQRDHRLAGAEAAGDLESGAAAAPEEPPTKRPSSRASVAAGREGRRVGDRDDLVDQAPVEDRPDLRKTDALDLVRPAAPPVRIEPCGLDGDAEDPGMPLREVPRDADERPGRSRRRRPTRRCARRSARRSRGRSSRSVFWGLTGLVNWRGTQAPGVEAAISVGAGDRAGHLGRRRACGRPRRRRPP